MKRKILFFTLAAFALTSCSKEVQPAQENIAGKSCELTINIHQDKQPGTKADGAYSEELGYETAVNSLQLLIFDKDGLLRHYSPVDVSGNEYKKTITMAEGEKHVWAVANAADLSSIKTETELMTTAVNLEDNSVEATKGFVMAGSKNVTLNAEPADVSVSISRIVGRVALCSITNSLPPAYGAITINRVFLSNVVGNQNLNGDAKPTLWYNKEGRMDEETLEYEHKIDGDTYKASCESLTYKAVNSSVATKGAYNPENKCVFYGMPNDSSTKAPTGFSYPFFGEQTTLVVETTISSNTYYYPIVMKDGISRNCSYSVYLTITDLGSDDPNKPVLRGSLNVTIEVAKWNTEVEVINETI